MRQSVVREPETIDRQRIVPWTPVLDAAGNAVGHVSDPAQEDGYLLVEKGFFFPRLVYVPLCAVARTDAFGIHLSVWKEELNGEIYAMPTASATAAIAG